MKNIINLLILVFLFSCNFSNQNDIKSILEEKIRYRGSVVSGQFVDYNFNDIVGSKKLDTLPQNIKLSDFMIRKGKQFEVKIIDTDKISTPYSTLLNEVEVCCKYDTTTIFSEIVNNKKYIFIPHYNKDKEWFRTFSYNIIFEIISPKSNYTKKRIDFDLPMWGLKIGDYIDKSKIDTSIEVRPKDEGGDTIRNQFLKSDKSIEISTLEFEHSNKLLITHIGKNNITETEFNDFVDYIKSKYPFVNIIKTIDNSGSLTFTRYTIDYFGLSIVFNKTDFNLSSSDLKTLTFQISDSYTTTKRIIENEGKKFIYNESNRTIH